jgi:rod shape determining protein RodA
MGLYQGTQTRLNFLPEQKNDFIFSVVGEEMGFLGVSLLMLLFFIFVYRGIKIAMKSKDMLGTLLATGIVSMIVFHLLVNVGMAAGIMPITGIPLPFFSYGGSSMLANMLGVGILLNVYMRRQPLTF